LLCAVLVVAAVERLRHAFTVAEVAVCGVVRVSSTPVSGVVLVWGDTLMFSKERAVTKREREGSRGQQKNLQRLQYRNEREA